MTDNLGVSFYSWRVETVDEDGTVRYINPFDERVDEFDPFSIEFDDSVAAVRWMQDFLDGPWPDDYRLLFFGGHVVIPSPA